MKELIPISSLEASEVAAKEQSLFYYDGPDKIVSSDDMREQLKNQKKATHSMPTGLARLDVAIGAIQSGELIAIGGPTKNGKTLLAQTITYNLSAQGVGCLWFTFEVPAMQFLEQLPNCGKFFMPQKLYGGNMDWLRDRIMEGKLKYKSHIVFVDNLHHLLDFTSVRNVSLDMGVIIRQLKRMALDLNVAIVVLCHSKKPQMVKGVIQEVSEWDLRDSSFIPQEADSTIMVQRKMTERGEFSNQAIVKVCLHRRTGTMGRKIHVIKTGNMIEEDVTFYV